MSWDWGRFSLLTLLWILKRKNLKVSFLICSCCSFVLTWNSIRLLVKHGLRKVTPRKSSVMKLNGYNQISLLLEAGVWVHSRGKLHSFENVWKHPSLTLLFLNLSCPTVLLKIYYFAGCLWEPWASFVQSMPNAPWSLSNAVQLNPRRIPLMTKLFQVV